MAKHVMHGIGSDLAMSTKAERLSRKMGNVKRLEDVHPDAWCVPPPIETQTLLRA